MKHSFRSRRGEKEELAFHMGYRTTADAQILFRGNPVKISCTEGGYLTFCLSGWRHHVLVHRFVWFCANGKIPKDLVVDRIRSDARLENLRLLTHSQNNQNRSPISFKAKCRAIVGGLRLGESPKDLAAEYNFSESYIEWQLTDELNRKKKRGERSWFEKQRSHP